MSAHFTQLGWDVTRPLAVVVAELDVDHPESQHANSTRTDQDRLSDGWQQVVRTHERTAPSVGCRHEVVTLFPTSTDRAVRDIEGLVRKVAGDRTSGRRSFSTGVSRVIYSLADLPAAYDQACTAVVVGRRINGPGQIAHFDELGVHRLLSLQTDKSELRSFTDDVLKSLSADNAEAADLRLTLQTLLDCNCNVAEASRALHMHYNTLRYRIGKLESVVGSFTDDPVLRLNVSLALQVMKMHEMS